ncbi:MAG: hypothetical protein K0R49_1022 [Burkholderiales bacterium]|jgi:hypothetical protein|nr:hypothetical protein [Burkholderiales bacterium]
MLRYDIGFDLQKSKQVGRVIGLKPNNQAAIVGLKENDIFSNLTYDYGNTNSLVEVTLVDSKIIEYTPAVPIQVLQFLLLIYSFKPI